MSPSFCLGFSGLRIAAEMRLGQNGFGRSTRLVGI
jgi:hypothetical protein